MHYLHISTRKALLAAVLDTLLATHVEALLEKGFSVLMDENRLDDLRSMYGLYALVDALPKLRLAFGGYIKRVGTAMVADAERERTMVQDLLAFKEKLDTLLGTALGANEHFAHSLKEAFETFINAKQVHKSPRAHLPRISITSPLGLRSRQNRAAELVAHFIDSKLRAGNKGTSDEELEEVRHPQNTSRRPPLSTTPC